MSDFYEDLLRNVRDAGALDDNNGAENWNYSDDKIAEAKQKLLAHEAEVRIDELERMRKILDLSSSHARITERVAELKEGKR